MIGSQHEPRLSEADVQRILRRAVEIDDRSPGELTIDDVRRIAEEVGLRASSVDQAYSELRQGLASTNTADSFMARIGRGMRRRVRAAAITTAAAIAGMALRDAYGPLRAEHLVALILLGFVSIRIASHHRSSNNQDDYHLENLGLWLGFLGGWSIVHGAFAGEMVLVVGAVWLLLTGVGAWIVGRKPTGDVVR